MQMVSVFNYLDNNWSDHQEICICKIEVKTGYLKMSSVNGNEVHSSELHISLYILVGLNLSSVRLRQVADISPTQ